MGQSGLQCWLMLKWYTLSVLSTLEGLAQKNVVGSVMEKSSWYGKPVVGK